MTYDEIVAQFAARGKYNPFQYNSDQMARDLGYSGTARTQTGRGGSPSESTGQGTEEIYDLTPDFEQFLKGYSYTPATSGGRNEALDIFDSSGKMVQDDYRTGDHKGAMMKFMGTAIPALALAGFGVGAYGAMGLGGGGAAAGGAGAGGAGAGALGLEGASFALPGAEAGFGLSNVGALGAEAGTVGGGLSAGGGAGYGSIAANSGALGAGGAGLSSGAGLTAPMYAGSGLGMTAASSASAGAAGGIPWLELGKAAIGPALSTGAQLYGANQAAGAMRDATNQANRLNAPAVAARNSALEQMQALLKDPSTITKQPGYQFGMDQGTKSLNSGAAARGQTYSGGQAKALTKFGQDYAGTKLDQSFNRLSQLASGGQSGTSQTVDNITSQGNANAMPWIVGSNAVADGINGLTAYGQRKNWWGG